MPTRAGDARITWYPAAGAASAVLAAGHGAGGGVEARDLQALAAALPSRGVTVALIEQPWRVAGRKVAPAPARLDAAWCELWPHLAKSDLVDSGLPLVAAGRSAGARVACRTARQLGAQGVLALSFPLHPPGRPERSRAGELLGTGLPTLVVQGGRDPFGRPEEFPSAPATPTGRAAEGVAPAGGAGSPRLELVEVPGGDHGFAVPKTGPIGQEQALALLTEEVARWLEALPRQPEHPGRMGPLPAPGRE